MLVLRTAYDALVVVHALAGLVVLLSLPVPLIARKGGTTHRRAGWVFVAAMAAVALSGEVIAAAWLATPELIAGHAATLDAARRAAVFNQVRGFGVFFATIGVMSAAAIWHGVSGLRLKTEAPAHWARTPDHVAWVATCLFGALLTLVGIAQTMPLFMAFGGLAVWGGIGDARFVLRPPKTRGAWLIRHLQAMLGGATAAITAFSALTLRRHFPELGAFSVGFWLVPVAIGVGATMAWTRVYKRQVG